MMIVVRPGLTAEVGGRERCVRVLLLEGIDDDRKPMRLVLSVTTLERLLEEAKKVTL